MEGQRAFQELIEMTRRVMRDFDAVEQRRRQRWPGVRLWQHSKDGRRVECPHAFDDLPEGILWRDSANLHG